MTPQLRILLDIHGAIQPALARLQSGDLKGARQNIDRLRELRSLMADYVKMNDVSKWSKDNSFVSLALNAAQAANNGFDAIEILQKALLSKGLNTDQENPDELIDEIFPFVWNWNQDLFIFKGEPSKEWLNALHSRGQKRAIFLSDKDQVPNFSSEDWIFSAEGGELDYFLEKWHPHFPRRYISYKADANDTEGADKHLQGILDALIRGQSSEKTIEDFSKRWINQQYKNCKKAISSRGPSELKSMISGQNVIVVSPGPSLSRNIEKLKELNDKFIIISVAQACPALLKHSIVPDIVAVVDPIDYASVLDGFDCSQSYLMIDDRCSPAFFEKNFRDVFLLSGYYSICGIAEATGHSRYVAKGGSVSVVAFALCLQAKAKSITLVGQDLSVDAGLYYNRPGSNTELTFSENEEFFFVGDRPYRVYKIPGYFGGEVRTRQDYWQYHFEFEQLAASAPDDIQLFNATEGGAFINGLEHISLSQVMQKLNSAKRDFSMTPLPTSIIARRTAKLKRFHQRQIKICDKITRFCRDILILLSSDTALNLNSVELDKLEKLIATETSKLPLLSGLLQGELKYFQSRLTLCDNLEENLSLSRSLYSRVRSAASDYRDLVVNSS